MADALPNPVDRWQTTLGWQPTSPQQQGFQQLYEQLVAVNQQINLTRITTPEEFWEKHLWDALQGIAPWLRPRGEDEALDPALVLPDEGALKVVDIGTGGGFPGLPVALVWPQWQVTLMDSTQKKITAVQSIAKALHLANVFFLSERAEHVGHQPTYREAFDLALVRAVGSTNTCAEYALPLVKPGGQVVLYRGQWESAEAAELNAVLPRLGGKLLQVRPAQTPITQSQRHYVHIQKVSRTPDTFPRAAGVPAKTPLRG